MTPPADQPYDPASDASSSATADKHVAVTRSEERLAVHTHVTPTERVTISTHLVTEQVTRTFTLRRQEIRVDRHPVPNGEAHSADSAEVFSYTVDEFVLYGEVLFTDIRMVPVETVRVHKYTFMMDETFSAQIDRERVEIDAPDSDR